MNHFVFQVEASLAKLGLKLHHIKASLEFENGHTMMQVVVHFL